MDVVYLDNRGRNVGSAIEEAVQSATEVSVAVVYATEGGVERRMASGRPPAAVAGPGS